MIPEPPDFSRSRAILVGTSEYRYLPPMPPALNSLLKMQELLTGQLCGWPTDRVSVFANVRTPGDLQAPLARLIRETTDVLFFYYVGHGQPTLSEDLCMGLTETELHDVGREFSGLLMNRLREMLNYCSARVKVVVLDCCFSGIATSNRQSPSDEAAYIAGITRVRGAYTLTASEATRPAHYADGPGALTQFTKHLIELIQSGISGMPSQLTLNMIFDPLAERLLRLRLPRPTRMSIESGGSFAFARNAAPPETYIDPAQELKRLRTTERALRQEITGYVQELQKLREQLRSSTALTTGQEFILQESVQEVRDKLDEARAKRARAQNEHDQAASTVVHGEPKNFAGRLWADNTVTSSGVSRTVSAEFREYDEYVGEHMGIFGPEHRCTLAARHDRAGRIGKAGNAAAAARLYASLAADYQKIHGPHHRGTLAARRQQAFWTSKAGNTEVAVQLYAALLEYYTRVLGRDHRYTKYARRGLESLSSEVATDR